MSEAELEIGEPHPAAVSAYRYAEKVMVTNPMLIESIYSTAMSGNRSAEICASTLSRIQNGEPVSDRYVLGLAWVLLEADEKQYLDIPELNCCDVKGIL